MRKTDEALFQTRYVVQCSRPPLLRYSYTTWLSPPAHLGYNRASRASGKHSRWDILCEVTTLIAPLGTVNKTTIPPARLCFSIHRDTHPTRASLSTTRPSTKAHKARNRPGILPNEQRGHQDRTSSFRGGQSRQFTSW